MKVVQINTTCGTGSTGKICVEISKVLSDHNIENYVLFSSGSSNYPLGIKYTDEKYIKSQALLSRLNGKYGFNSVNATNKLIQELKIINPDVIHLHNLHGHNCNLEMLFEYIREESIKVFWTFHDCWAFTGYCPHYSMIKCDKWIEGCRECPQYRKYSWLYDRSAYLFRKKQEIVQGIDLTVITPSQWMAEQVSKSFLKAHDIRVINNGIDLNVFRPRKSQFKKRYKIGQDKKVLLGVASVWGERKGLDVFVKLAENLDSEKYQIILVGINRRLAKCLPENIVCIDKTSNQTELAEIYSVADLFINPTREDTFPTVNIEALACGLPIITFRTGGSAEIVDSLCGRVVDCDDFDNLKKEIESILNNNMFDKADCVNRANNYGSADKFNEYYKLYKMMEKN